MVLLYAFTLAGWGYIAGKLRHQPWTAFRVYATYSAFRCLILFSLFAANDMGLYTRAYWPLRAVTIALLGAFTGELWGLAWIGFLVGTGTAAVELLGIPSVTIDADRLYGFLVTGTAFLAIIYRPEQRRLAYGILVANLFPAIAYTWDVSMNGGALRYVHTVSMAAAQLFWIRALWAEKREA